MQIKLLISICILSITACTTKGPGLSSDRKVAQTAVQATGGGPTLKLMSWNMKHLGRKMFDPRQATPILSEGDLITMQEVNGNGTGLKALQAIADHLQELTHERICMGLSEVPSGDKERYAYLWKDSRISYVKVNGEVMEHCPDSAITVRLGAKNADSIQREPAFGTFYFKPTGKYFVFASIHLVPTAKKPEHEVQPLFDTFSEVTGPVVVAGDYNLDSAHSSFEAAKALGFQPAMVGVKTSLSNKTRTLSKAYDNFWFKGVKQAAPPQVINLYNVFTEKEPKEIYENFSDHCPILGKFEFVP